MHLKKNENYIWIIFHIYLNLWNVFYDIYINAISNTPFSLNSSINSFGSEYIANIDSRMCFFHTSHF